MDHTVVAEHPRRNPLNAPVIVVLLLVAVPLLALLVLQQDRVIEAQKVLIRQLSADSQQLNAFRVREQQSRNTQNNPATKNPESKAPRAENSQPSGTRPDQKNHNRRQTNELQPHLPQEYPGARPMPTRKSA